MFSGTEAVLLIAIVVACILWRRACHRQQILNRCAILCVLHTDIWKKTAEMHKEIQGFRLISLDRPALEKHLQELETEGLIERERHVHYFRLRLVAIYRFRLTDMGMTELERLYQSCARGNTGLSRV